MKFLYLLLFAIVSTSVNGQEIKINPDTGMFESQGVVEIEGKTQDELYSSALEWIALNYASANDVIQLQDKASGKIVVKGSFPSTMFKKRGSIPHTLRLEFKDNRFRYTYSNLSYYSTGSGDMSFEGSMYRKEKIITSAEEDIRNSIQSIKNFIQKEDSEDW
ncbi:DUF4468 domain-containing protein [Salinimicrobium sp. TIG7-5_MAKvit]|uniref:DUF4468 domain-containing protein n=1 Tax=Salinimicrobium sp. TIG7-5_MAKvit TaxID=3121289 RepID=UPI003C6E020E